MSYTGNIQELVIKNDILASHQRTWLSSNNQGFFELRILSLCLRWSLSNLVTSYKWDIPYKMKIACMRKCLHALLMLRFILIAESFADWMTNDFCDRELAVGQVNIIFNEKWEKIMDLSMPPSKVYLWGIPFLEVWTVAYSGRSQYGPLQISTDIKNAPLRWSWTILLRHQIVEMSVSTEAEMS